MNIKNLDLATATIKANADASALDITIPALPPPADEVVTLTNEDIAGGLGLAAKNVSVITESIVAKTKQRNDELAQLNADLAEAQAEYDKWIQLKANADVLVTNAPPTIL